MYDNWIRSIETKNSREREAFKDSINRLKISELAKLWFLTVVSASAMVTRAIATILHQRISLFWSFNQNDVVWLLYIKKKEVGSHPGLPGSAGSTRFRWANSQTGFCLDPDRSHARVDPPGRSGFQNYVSYSCRLIYEKKKNKKIGYYDDDINSW